MWSGNNCDGCIAARGAPDVEGMDDEQLAQLKGIPIAVVQEAKTVGMQKITDLMMLVRFLEWFDELPRNEHPWRNIYNQQEVVDAVNTWCKAHWIYSVPELGWTTARIAATASKPLLLKFNDHIGKQIDWLQLLGVGKRDRKALRQIFKQASKKEST